MSFAIGSEGLDNKFESINTVDFDPAGPWGPDTQNLNQTYSSIYNSENKTVT